ncbi:MAG TPA: glycosyltransferase family 4 protein [Armatimonadota bacterium]|jgi:glycosyltransferase involved in cell wall biosynthesis
MRVLLVQHPSITLDLAHTGGIEVVELNQLRELNARGVPTRLCVASLRGKEEGIQRVRDWGWQNRYLQGAYYLNARRQDRRADILHGHYTPLLPLIYPRNSVVHYHGLTLSGLPLYRHPACARRYHQAHYLFCARWLAEGFAEMYPAMPRDHLHVVYNAADPRAFHPAPERRANPVPRIVFYAGWIPEKGLYELLEAVARLEAKRTDFEVHLGGSAFTHYRRAGSEELDREVRARAGALATVRLIGHVAHEDLPALLRTMDIGVVPSTYDDPFPLVPLEMMASGLPVVAFRAGGLPEAVVDGETGFLVENRNVEALAAALERLIEDAHLRQEMSAQARRRVEQFFTWDRHVDQLLEIYEQIIHRNEARR